VQQVTARFSFPLFWPAYTAGAITTLFGPTFEPAKRRGREFGLLCFSAPSAPRVCRPAQLHWGRVSSRVFLILGVAALWTYLVALFSIPRLQRRWGQRAFKGLVGLGQRFAKIFLG